jgi:hypothetical protein
MSQLNVVLHGLMTIYEEADRIRVFLPNVTTVHVFRAGSWFAETDLQPRKAPYVLKGVNPPQPPATFGGNGIAHLGQVELAPGWQKVTHAELQLPRPKQIFELRATTVNPANDFTGKDAGKLAGATKLPSGCALVYDTDDVQNLSLDGHDWKPPKAPNQTFTNLHVFAEEDVPGNGTAQHALDAFRNMIKGLFNLDIQLARPQTPLPFDPLTDTLPDNVDPRETDELTERLNQLQAWGNILRQELAQIRQPTAGAPNPNALLAPFAPTTGIDSKTGSCSQITASGVHG